MEGTSQGSFKRPPQQLHSHGLSPASRPSRDAHPSSTSQQSSMHNSSNSNLQNNNLPPFRRNPRQEQTTQHGHSSQDPDIPPFERELGDSGGHPYSWEESERVQAFLQRRKDTGASPDLWERGSGSIRSDLLGARKERASLPKSNGASTAPISRLPVESLTQIFANLSAQSLATCTLVCKSWHRIINDDASWQDAFFTSFGLQRKSDAELHGQKYSREKSVDLAPGRRLDASSWRVEYILRTRLLERWAKSRAPTITHDPRIAHVTSIYVDWPAPANNSASPQGDLAPVMLSMSLLNGAAVRSEPFTGRVHKGYVEGDPGPDHFNLLAAGPPGPAGAGGMAPGENQVTCFRVYGRESGPKLIVWGMLNGEVRTTMLVGKFGLSQIAQAHGNLRGTPTPRTIGSRETWHTQKVTAISFEPYPSTYVGTSGIGFTGSDKQKLKAGLTSKASKAGWTAPGKKGNLTEVPAEPKVGSTNLWFATAAKDAHVKIWDPTPLDGEPARCLWTSSERIVNGVGEPDRVVTMAFEPARPFKAHTPRGPTSCLALGTETGFVHCWYGIDVHGATAPLYASFPPSYFGHETIPPTPVSHIFVDPSSSPSADSLSMLVHHKGDPHFVRLFPFKKVDETNPRVKVTYGDRDDNLAAITSIRPDFDLSKVYVEAPASNAHVSIDISIEPVGESTNTLRRQDLTPDSNDEKPATFGRRKYVIAGDAQGRAFIWDWESPASLERNASSSPDTTIHPVRYLQGYGCKVTAIDVTDLHIFIGSVNGVVRAFDPLAATLIRTFSERSASRHPSRLLAAGQADEEDEERYAVANISATRDAVVASIGGKILAWKLTESKAKSKKKSKAGGRMSHRTERFRSENELRQDIRESQADLYYENEDTQRRLGYERDVVQRRIPSNLGNMTEAEAVEYAIMLSRDEEERRRLGGASSTSPMQDDFMTEELDQMTLDEDLTLSHDQPPPADPDAGPSRRMSTVQGSTASSTRSQTSDEDEDEAPSRGASIAGSYARQFGLSEADRYLSPSPAASPAMRPVGPPSAMTPWRTPLSSSVPSPRRASFDPYHNPHAKLQISPRPSPVYAEGEIAALSVSPAPDMSESAWPQLPPNRTPANPSPIPTQNPAVVRRGWNEVARSPPQGRASTSATPNRASSLTGSPALGASPSPSLLTARLRGAASTTQSSSPAMQAASGIAEEEMDEDLRFAIELSLAEEQSRKEKEQQG